MSKKTFYPASRVAIANDPSTPLCDPTSTPDPIKDRRLAKNILRPHGQLQPIGVCKVDNNQDKPDVQSAKVTVIFGRRRVRACRLIEAWQKKPETAPVEVDKEELKAYQGVWADLRPRPLNALEVILAENVERHQRTTAELISLSDRLMEELKASGVPEKHLLSGTAHKLGIDVQTVRQHVKAANLSKDIEEVGLAIDEGKLAAKDAAKLANAIDKAKAQAATAAKADDKKAAKLAQDKLVEARAAAKAAAKAALARESGKRAPAKFGPAARRKFQDMLEAEAAGSTDAYILGARDAVRIFDGADPSERLAEMAKKATAKKKKKVKEEAKTE